MAMDLPTVVGIAITVINSVLLAVLASIWLKNYRQFKSTMILGLVAFSAVLLVENLIAIGFFFSSMKMLYAMDSLVGMVVLGMRVLELIAIAFLTYATLE